MQRVTARITDMEQEPIEQSKDELSERFLVAAFERAWGVMPFEWRKVADSINMDHKSAEVLAAKLETTGWLRRVGPEYLCLTEKIEPVYVASKATNPPIDLADTRERHFLAMAYERGGVFNFSMLARRAGFYEGEDAPGFHDFHRKLYSAGYAFGTSQSTLTQKGIYHAKRLAEEMNAKSRPNDDKFCARWKGHQSEAQKFLIWAWKQHKGDLHKPVDLRAYAFATGRGRYDAKAIEDWVVSNEYMICSATRTYANQHAFDFWHEPYNAHSPYGHF